MRTNPLLLSTLRLAALGAWLMAISPGLLAADTEKNSDQGPMKAETFSGLELRGIGPAMVSGRIADLAVNPKDKSTWYVAAASGGNSARQYPWAAQRRRRCPALPTF